MPTDSLWPPTGEERDRVDARELRASIFARLLALALGSAESVRDSLTTTLAGSSCLTAQHLLQAIATTHTKLLIAGSNPVSRSNPSLSYFEQKGVSDYLGGVQPPANGTVSVLVLSGSAFVYGAITDNRTNDARFRLFQVE